MQSINMADTSPLHIIIPTCDERRYTKETVDMLDVDGHAAATSYDGVCLVHLNTLPAGPWWREHFVNSSDTLQVRPTTLIA